MMRAKNKPTITRRIPRQPTHEDTPLAPKQNGYRPRTRLRTLEDLDGRTHAAQQAHRLVAQLEADLGKDPSTAERELIKRAALLGAIVEDTEVAWLERRPADLSIYGKLVDRQRRILEALGLKRTPRDINGRGDLAPDQLDKLIDAVRATP
jgi:hypothetical protein